MIKRSFFKSRYLPYLLIFPQILVTLTFFYWPAIQGLSQSFFLSDPFGRQSKFVWFYNYIELFTDPLYLKSIFTTFFFSLAVAAVSLSLGLFIASMANRALKAKALTRTLLIWPYAVAPAISGIM
ncbi:MAG: sugar ABC transporter permease, partial [Desulfobacula sp.]|nr:sugar ABC transporter permease [Desulfobacula sp.]